MQMTTTEIVYSYLISFMKESHGIPPTLREIIRDTHIASTNTASYHLRKLERAGKIRFLGESMNRGYYLTGAKWIPPDEAKHE